MVLRRKWSVVLLSVYHVLIKPSVLFQKPFKPVKYFSIDRVFRNENLDDTHLAEFHQIEGVVADYGLTLGDLIGTINSFFMKLGTGGSVVVKLYDCGRTCYFSAIDGTLYIMIYLGIENHYVQLYHIHLIIIFWICCCMCVSL